MNDKELYKEILGIYEPWEVDDVRVDLESMQVEIVINYTSELGACSECQRECPTYDQRERRRWRHLDTCQLKTSIVCDVPRVKCSEHGVKTMAVPWAEKSSRHTRLFERLTIDLLRMTKNQTKTAVLLRTSFDSVHHIMHRAVERGLSLRQETVPIVHLGIDEKSFQSHHHYLSVLSDLDHRRVVDVVEHRTLEASKTLITTALSQEQRESVKSVSVDMWEPFITAASKTLPQADIVHDRYHVSAYLNQAVDTTRRQEAKALAGRDDTSLKGSRYIFLKNPQNFTDAQRTRFEHIQALNLTTAEAWRMKENFKSFFTSATLEDARNFFTEWFNNVHVSAIAPMKKVAVMLHNHLQGLLNYVKHHITNAVAESLNSLIQEIKYVARGFRRFENFRIAILFFLGKLDLYPHKSR